MTTTDLTTKANGSLPAYLQVAGSWGAENTSASDTIIPRINLTQQMSEVVVSEKAKSGQFISNVDGKILGGKDEPLDFIPFYVTRTLVKYEVDSNGKQKYVSQEELTPSNERIQYEEIIGNTKYKNVKNFNVYVLLPEEMESGQYLPYLLTFRNMSYNAGKKLSTLFEKLKAFKAPIAAKTFSLSTFLKENEKGKFYVYDVEQKPGYNTEAQVDAARNWYEKIIAGQARIADDLEDTTDAGPDSHSSGTAQY